MNAPTTANASRAPWLIGGLLLVSLIVIGLVAGEGGSGDGPPLSPFSTAPDGTRALVLLLSESGANVVMGQRVPDATSGVAVLLRDGLDEQSRDQLRAWVEGGGTLVVADPDSPFAARISGFGVSGQIDRGTCDVLLLADVNAIAVPFGFEFRVGGEAESCYGDGRAAFVVSTSRGQGTVVSIGGAEIFTNDLLDEADNSVLAHRLLFPRNGATTVAILDPNAPGSGTTTLGDLISDRVFQAILQLGVAFVVYALWRSRRVGRPVTESQPVAIAGSQFVRAVGGLQQRSRSTARAASTLRSDTRRLLSERFGVPINLDTAMLAELTATRTGLDHDQVAAALGDSPILDEASLVALGQQLDAIRQHALNGHQEVLHGRTR